MTDTPYELFDPDRLERQMAVSSAARFGLIMLVVVGWAGALFVRELQSVWLILLGGGLIGWLVGNHVSSRAARSAVESAHLAASDQPLEALETTLRDGLNRFTLYRTVRVMLYHQLAVLRRRQGRFAEAAAICRSLLWLNNLGVTRDVRERLLLLLTDVSLHLGDLAAAFQAMQELARRPLDLAEALHCAELRTRYELACGYRRTVVDTLDERIRQAELMPPDRCLRLHRLLADAARDAGLKSVATWLDDRVELLGGKQPEAPRGAAPGDATLARVL